MAPTAVVPHFTVLYCSRSLAVMLLMFLSDAMMTQRKLAPGWRNSRAEGGGHREEKGTAATGWTATSPSSDARASVTAAQRDERRMLDVVEATPCVAHAGRRGRRNSGPAEKPPSQREACPPISGRLRNFVSGLFGRAVGEAQVIGGWKWNSAEIAVPLCRVAASAFTLLFDSLSQTAEAVAVCKAQAKVSLQLSAHSAI